MSLKYLATLFNWSMSMIVGLAIPVVRRHDARDKVTFVLA